MHQTDIISSPDAAEVMTQAVVRAADRLGLTQSGLARILGVSEATVSRLAGGRTIDPASKEGELALLLLRVYRSLDAMVGGDEHKARLWLHAKNNHLEAVPSEQIQTVMGLVNVAGYLDTMRGGR